MTARFSHKRSLRRSGEVVVTVALPGGGFTEAYQATEAELRRFAWAVLADFDPAEADVVARGDHGVDAAALAKALAAGRPRTQTQQHRVARGRSREALEPGCPAHGLLALLSAGTIVTSGEGARRLDLKVADASARLFELNRAGFVERTNTGGQGIPARWAVTGAGETELERLGPFALRATPSTTLAA